eukprot:TRINITY_DN3099_c0_g1_i1.p1 TRINITY_DN3099_c0_g1~~TRINITY_DN3099_c0_g1_i1.p1  ORF type:complete len:439 (+),score=105.65 TRINITY_DN3099_c0_g1_i1:628-1944(+)
MIDSCGLDENPGWPLRNILTLLSVKFHLQSVEVICLRFSTDGLSFSNSLILSVQIPPIVEGIPKATGWEKNQSGKFLPSSVDLSSILDPIKIADSAAELNLKLMKWRLAPDLDLSNITSKKCLLVGSGTLGCNVARCLLAWGIRHISLIDNGVVSYSNPARQSLFEFTDSVQRKLKAEAARDALKRIVPSANVTSHVLSVAMSGHAIIETERAKMEKDISQFVSLVKEHDVIFLLTDSRESRWLPTLLASQFNKIAINAALGFDSYLVMRHGVDGDNPLGCYFCNDIAVPIDSLSNRPLDQQCTVTRPGTSMIASSLAVELLISILNHHKGPQAPASEFITNPFEARSQLEESRFGLVPHQIRGFVSNFSQIFVRSNRYDKCIACSKYVKDQFILTGNQFIVDVCNQSALLEEVCGLKVNEESPEISILDDDDAIFSV